MKLFKLYPKSIDGQLNPNLNLMPSNINISAIALFTVFGLFSTLPAIAENKTTVLFQPPSESERPESTEGAASRGGSSGQSGVCASDRVSQSISSDRLNFTALAPQRNYGLTTLEHPTLWIYLPQTSAKQAILSIKQEGKTPHWQQSVSLTPKTGITGIKLSDDAPALEINQNYQWAVILVCGDRPNPNDPVVTAWIKRIDQLENGDSNSPISGLEQAAVYARQGIWYDALNILVAQRSSLSNWQNIWGEYLQSGGLERFAKEPVILD
ncbi:DUF928 domain-containing protein [Pleurocapsales cyanobacterium LEGE 10410]|nr:DUF928 domain-containing protein [Pleurocapsales cyanobacterium LEGE 10410]